MIVQQYLIFALMEDGSCSQVLQDQPKEIIEAFVSISGEVKISPHLVQIKAIEDGKIYLKKTNEGIIYEKN